MTDAALLTREYAVFSAYLGCESPSTHVADRYVLAHANLPPAGDRFDHRLVTFARGGAWRCSLADAYARRLRPYGLLRRKLTLTLALLEAGRATHSRYDQAVGASFVTTLAMLFLSGVWWGVRSLIALAIVGPLHLATIVASGGTNG